MSINPLAKCKPVNQFPQINRRTFVDIRGEQAFRDGQLIDYLRSQDLLNIPNTTCDFGAGTAGPTIALRKLLEEKNPHATLIGIEPEAEDAQTIITSGVLPPENLFQSDGFKLLREQFKGCFDLITFFRILPKFIKGKEESQNLVDTIYSGLTEQGQALITTETNFFNPYLKDNNVKHTKIPRFSVNKDPKNMLPLFNTYILNRSDIGGLTSNPKR
ncbi:MAG: hypothetical protein QNJ31_08775 [Candidatus Caenarcaniphilales bacterium]|nr:hypothetical protein [Candidatus Caenarcaniphilales bacterium]